MIEFFKRHAITIAIVGSIASVISIPLAITLYLASIHNPDISFLTKQIKIYDSSSKVVELMSSGRKIDSDVYAYEIVLWNSGSAPIDPLLIRQFPTLDFTEARAIVAIQDVLSSPAPYVAPNIITDDGAKSVSIQWKTLDPGAAIKLSLLYSSDKPVEPKMHARIVGLEPTRYSSILGPGSSNQAPQTIVDALASFGIGWLICGAFICVVLLLVHLSKKLLKRSGWTWKLQIPASVGRVTLWLLLTVMAGFFGISMLLGAVKLARAYFLARASGGRTSRGSPHRRPA
jgi:hypothetical protein